MTSSTKDRESLLTLQTQLEAITTDTKVGSTGCGMDSIVMPRATAQAKESAINADTARRSGTGGRCRNRR